VQRLVALAARRPGTVVAVTVVLAVLGGLLALRLEPSTGTDTLVSSGSETYEATERYRERFGEDAVLVLVRGPLTENFLVARQGEFPGSNLERIIGLEGCLSGNLPQGAEPPGGRGGPCGRLAETKPVKVVFGPGTFVNESARQLTQQFIAESRSQARRADRIAEAARRVAREQGRSREQARRVAAEARELVNREYTRNVLQLALRYGLRGEPRIDDPAFVSRLLFDAARPAGTPKERFAYLFPSRDAALIQVRLKPGLSDRQREEAIALVRAATRMPQWRLRGATEQRPGYVVTGAPVVVSDLTSEISRSIALLLAAALLVMAVTLALVFRAPRRLLPLLVALGAAGLTFGGLSLAGASLTMASIAVLPVLIGLAVDYAIQLQSRTLEERSPHRMARRGAPTVVTAAAATAAGFLVLLASPVPMVRGFGVLLVLGIAVAVVLALTLGVAGLVLRVPDRGPAGALAAAGRGAAELLEPAGRAIRGAAGRIPVARAARWAVATAQRRPTRVLAIAAGVAVLGLALDTQTKVESDVQELVPQDLPALVDLRALQEDTGVGGQVDVMVEGRDLTDPRVITWMNEFQRSVLRANGYREGRGCGEADLCPAFSLPDLFDERPRSAADVRALLDVVPPYFQQAVITPNRRTATLAFGIKLMPLERQAEVLEDMRERLDPPPGVSAHLVGLPVLGAEANSALSSEWRRLLTLVIGLVAVFLVLLAAFRSTRRAVIPLVPIALASGWSALVLFALRIPLNPMSVTLGALVIAISTEFSVLLSERYRQERAAGHAPAEALARTYRSTGSAVLASGITAIAGFAVLVVSDITMLRQFGFVTVIDLTVSLLGVLVVLPSVLLLAERGTPLRVRAPRLRRRRAVSA